MTRYIIHVERVSAKLKIVHGHGHSNIILASLLAPLMFAGLYNQSPLSTMIWRNRVSLPRSQALSLSCKGGGGGGDLGMAV